MARNTSPRKVTNSTNSNNKSLYSLINAADQQTSSALNVAGVAEQLCLSIYHLLTQLLFYIDILI